MKPKLIPAPHGYSSVAVWLPDSETGEASTDCYMEDPIIAFLVQCDEVADAETSGLPADAYIRHITAAGLGKYPNSNGVWYVIKCPDGVYRRGEMFFSDLDHVRDEMRKEISSSA